MERQIRWKTFPTHVMILRCKDGTYIFQLHYIGDWPELNTHVQKEKAVVLCCYSCH